MTQDEVRMLDNLLSILFIRGERPIIDYKYDILKHPNYKNSSQFPTILSHCFSNSAFN